MADPDPEGSVTDIRNVFGNMGMNDSETVALIGGGHAFGKMHGACTDPPCGDGIGNNTFTSGFEGTWIENPTNWTNDYFTNLLKYEWNVTTGPGGHYQVLYYVSSLAFLLLFWVDLTRPCVSPISQWFPISTNGTEPANITMLTADVALLRDPNYLALVEEYAADVEALEFAFSHAWYKLMSRDMGPVTRCIGDLVAPAQPFQDPLPDPPATLPDYAGTRAAIEELIANNETLITAFTRLAYQCADTYRNTDKAGGCNGARIRFLPENNWTVNAGLDEVIASLEAAKTDEVSYADLIVLAGMVATNSTVEFCGGRTDAEDGSGSEELVPRLAWYTPTTLSVTDNFAVKGLTLNEGVALAGRPVEGRSPMVSNELFVWLTEYQFEGPDNTTGVFTEIDGNKTVTAEEYALYEDTDMRAIVQNYAKDEELFLSEFYAAWNKIMIQDRYDGNRGNLCSFTVPTAQPTAESPTESSTEPPAQSPSSASSMALDLSLAVLVILASVAF
jgi:catalase (peroxidase I)